MHHPLRFYFSTASLLGGWLLFSSVQLGSPDTSLPRPRIDPSAQQGSYLGYGIGIHGGDLIYPGVFDALKPRFVRMEFGPDWDKLLEPVPTGVSVEELVDYITRNYNADAYDRLMGARDASDFFAARETQLIQILFEIPYQWRTQDESSQLKPEHIEDLARFHTAHLSFLDSHGVRPHYMELSNEPDGFWNGYIAPADYNRLVLQCAALFDQHLDQPPRILGPGLTFLNLHGWGPAYFEALEPAAIDALHGWSTHCWDEVEFQSSRPEYTYGVWQPFIDQTTRLDPERSKPVFVTEYATDVLHYGDQSFASPRDQITHNAVGSWPYAVRVVANSITHLNRGANALVLYRLSNSHWHDTGWGIIQPLTPQHFRAKPIYFALAEFFSCLPVGATILQPTWYSHDDPITLSVFLEDGGKLTVLATNTSSKPEHQVLQLPSSYATIENLAGLSSDGHYQPQATIQTTKNGKSLSLELPPQSIARIELLRANHTRRGTNSGDE